MSDEPVVAGSSFYGRLAGVFEVRMRCGSHFTRIITWFCERKLRDFPLGLAEYKCFIPSRRAGTDWGSILRKRAFTEIVYVREGRIPSVSHCDRNSMRCKTIRSRAPGRPIAAFLSDGTPDPAALSLRDSITRNNYARESAPPSVNNTLSQACWHITIRSSNEPRANKGSLVPAVLLCTGMRQSKNPSRAVPPTLQCGNERRTSRFAAETRMVSSERAAYLILAQARIFPGSHLPGSSAFREKS